VVADTPLLQSLGWRRGNVEAGRLWGHLADAVAAQITGEAGRVIEGILSHGTLSHRIRTALSEDWDRESLLEVYGRLQRSLFENRPFEP